MESRTVRNTVSAHRIFLAKLWMTFHTYALHVVRSLEISTLGEN